MGAACASGLGSASATERVAGINFINPHKLNHSSNSANEIEISTTIANPAN
jgi:hypothetical protein